MKAKRGILCRDNGTVFLQVFLDGQSESATFELTTTDRYRNPLPGCLYHITENEYVIAVPQLDIDIHAEVREVMAKNAKINASNDISQVDLKSFLIAGNWAKWESRFNYRTNRNKALKIRNIHRNYYDQKVKIELTQSFINSFAEHSDCVLKGIVTVPSVNPTKIVFSVIDSKGNRLNEKLLEHSNVDLVYDGEEEHFRIFPFSIRVPQKTMDLCFVVDVPGEPTLNSFLTFPANEYKKFKDRLSGISTSAECNEDYGNWFECFKASSTDLARQKNTHLEHNPLFSVVMPLYHTPVDVFQDTTKTLLVQSYENWELILVNSTPSDIELKKAVEKLVQTDDRVKAIELNSNLGISGNTNKGLEVASGDYVAFFDHDDMLEPDILFEYAYAINDDPSIDMLYCDEDILTRDGKYIHPYFKPDFSIDQLRYNNYVCHMLTIRRSLLEEIGFIPEGYDGAQDHYLTLRISEETDNIHHVPKVLYHWREIESSSVFNSDSKSYANEAGMKAVRGNLKRLGIDATVEPYGPPFAYRVHYKMPAGTKISIIIPSHDEVEVLSNCIDSIVRLTEYPNYEIVIVENNSVQKELFDYYDELTSGELPVKVVTWEGKGFNFSSLVNFGVANSDGDVIVLLNNDIEVIEGNWLDELGGIACRKDVGVVGPTLYYPDDTIQHAGLGLVNTFAIDFFKESYKEASHTNYYSFHDMTRNVLAVTGACLAVRRSVYEEVGGFDEEFVVAFNDVDFCLRIVDAGYLNVYTANTSLYHLESYSRKADDGFNLHHRMKSKKETRERFLNELLKLQVRWHKYYVNGDPYYNINLNQSPACARYYAL